MTTPARNDLIRGSTDLLVLSVLAGGPLYGYAIIKQISVRSDEAIRLSPGVLYPLLHELEHEDPGHALRAALELEPEGVDAACFAQSRNVSAQTLRALSEASAARSLSVRNAPRLFSPARIDALSEAVSASLADYHAREPERMGPVREELLRGCAGRASVLRRAQAHGPGVELR